MIFDRQEVTAELYPILEDGLPCIKEPIFWEFLSVELERAERYGSFVSLVMFRLTKPTKGRADLSKILPEYTRFLKSKLRRTDYLAYLKDSTLAIMLLNSKSESTQMVLDRLRADSRLYFSARDSRIKLQAASTVFPTEASSKKGLIDQVFDRLH